MVLIGDGVGLVVGLVGKGVVGRGDRRLDYGV